VYYSFFQFQKLWYCYIIFKEFAWWFVGQSVVVWCCTNCWCFVVSNESIRIILMDQEQCERKCLWPVLRYYHMCWSTHSEAFDLVLLWSRHKYCFDTIIIYFMAFVTSKNVTPFLLAPSRKLWQLLQLSTWVFNTNHCRSLDILMICKHVM
jgi:hypothetical protein